MANSPTLHLIIDKGPKEGETLIQKPGTLIRIGRVMSGNTFTIKDPGISQKHLTIEFVSEISKWSVKDLNTSNGTLVNDVKIPPLNPFPLSNGDIVKIGQATSISVIIDSGVGEIDAGMKRGRKRGRGIRDSVDEEEKCVEEMKNPRIGRSTRGNSSRVSKKDEILDVSVNDNVEIRPRRGNSSRVSKKEDVLDAVEGVQLRPRRGNSSRVSKNDGILDDLVGEGVKLRPRRGNSSRVSKKDDNLDNVVDENFEARPKRGNSSRVLKKDEILNDVVGESVEVRPRRAGLRSQANELTMENERLTENENIDLVVEDSIEVPKNVKRGRPKKAPAQTRASSAKTLECDEKEEVNVESNDIGAEEQKEVDFEKMTLGEWFDSMEKYLPQAINEVAEQMIESLKEKARRFDEYVANVANAG